MSTVSQLLDDPRILVGMSERDIELLGDVLEGAAVDIVASNPELREQLKAQIQNVANEIREVRGGPSR